MYVCFGYIPQTIFENTQVQVLGSMNADTINAKTQVNNQQKNYYLKKLKYILDKSRQSIDVNKYEHPTGTLVKALLRPAGVGNTYVQFVYIPQTIF